MPKLFKDVPINGFFCQVLKEHPIFYTKVSSNKAKEFCLGLERAFYYNEKIIYYKKIKIEVYNKITKEHLATWLFNTSLEELKKLFPYEDFSKKQTNPFYITTKEQEEFYKLDLKNDWEYKVRFNAGN